MGRKVAIVGIGQTEHRTRHPEVSHEEMINQAVRNALEDAQLTIKDIDAVLNGNMDLFEGHNLFDTISVAGSGAYLKPGRKMNTGGTTGGTMATAAWYHVASGLYDVVLTVGSDKLEESGGNTTPAIITFADPLTYRPFYTGAISTMANMAANYMRETGCGEEPAAIVRAQASDNAAKNPYAHLRTRYTVEDVMKSPLLVYPLRLLHMCPQSSGACALVLASEAKAKKISKTPVWYNDHVVSHTEAFKRALAPDPTPAALSQTDAARKLFGRNGITNPRRDIDVCELYTPSAWAEISWMEDFLLCEKGEAWKLVEKGVTALDGEFPINPSGGVLTTNPIGATGLLRVAEAALQIRGEAGEHQVPREVKTAIASAYGGCNWTIMHLLSKYPE
jgi:acetyl-CoA C-acetyltransferase